ncbi:hypothetical protein BDN72DRAFT_629221 [Pluteus cervinus]|uniref:Uncharacterized protein n=1 Tax=Pluteus cervinus TaxID=181527 RepID=A0ACD3BA80_9AGAR|nr:hypothetical protein BDN72DRAFT_629221 [Pluteus cervinus]
MLTMDPKFDIEAWLAKNPPKTYDPVPSPKGLVESWVSHQFPPAQVNELSDVSFFLYNLSNARFVGRTKPEIVTPLELRPPEILLGGEWDESIDIWMLGNLVFYLLTLKTPFTTSLVSFEYNCFWPRSFGMFQELSKDWPKSSVDFLLAQMSAFCQKAFPPELLQTCENRDEYFDASGRLKRYPTCFKRPWFDRLKYSLVPLTLEEQLDVANFMNRCLQTLPSKRATAEELLQDPWLTREDAT